MFKIKGLSTIKLKDYQLFLYLKTKIFSLFTFFWEVF